MLPTAEQLRARIDALPPKVPADLKQRLEDALAMVVAANAATDRQRKLELEDGAKRLLGITVGSAKLGRITGKLDPELRQPRRRGP